MTTTPDYRARAAAAATRGPAMTLPNDVARCPGDGYQDDDGWYWREGCENCLRRTSPGGSSSIKPPPIIAFECEYRLAPEGC